MNEYLSRLNPTERRFVVGVALLVFIIINLVWVRPHFSDWGDCKIRLANARGQQANYDATLAKADRLKADLDKIEIGSAAVPPEDQAIDFLRTIQIQAAQAGVQFGGSQHSTTRTNDPFFIEQLQTVSIISGEQQLIDFLYNLGTGNSLIRARDLSVHPDQPHQQLNTTITLVASYQKKLKKPTANIQTPAPAARPAAVPTPAPPTKTATVNTSTPAMKPATVKTSPPPANPFVIPPKPKIK